MSRFAGPLVGIVLVVLLAVGAWRGIAYYGATRYDAGYGAAIAAGREARDSAAVANVAIESGLRAELLGRDTAVFRKEQEYASNLSDAQRLVRAGDDRLRCPAAGSVQPPAETPDRPVTADTAADGGGPNLVPEAAADVLGYGAAIAGLVRRYDEVVFRYESCRAVNAGP
jgi:hypothetical protein